MKALLNNKNVIFSLICLIVSGILLIMPTGFEKQIYVNAESVQAKVLETNESTVYNNGLLKQGSQVCQVELLSGSFKGERVEAVNLLTGKLEFDKLFKVGDKALVLVEKSQDGELIFVNMLDHYRISAEWFIIFVFMGVLILFSGSTGVRTIISFVFSLLCIWKVLIPMLLKGYPPMALGLIIGLTMATTTLILVGGFTKKAYCAIAGTGVASIITCLMAVGFGTLFKIDGTVMAWSESLLYAGFEGLDLTQIYQAAIYLSCSGALVDLAMDLSAALEEVVEKKPDLSRREIWLSGMRIGKSVVGSQTTTLLLAYMGSFITVMMVYMAQGTPMISILNSKSIASEVLHTFVGCIGLVIVCPLTATICSYAYKKKSNVI
ncbi:MAG: YibE/F family protein [Niameybacter sp.]|uniref:YibE/F family protein n=1 Tax=Niameybacter sp. TaxID=2033640 RepID=UPI002FC5D1C7